MLQHYFEEPGLLYDCLQFLSLCHEDKELAQTKANTYFLRAKEGLWEEVTQEHLSPLICRQGQQGSFLSTVLLNKPEYSQCSFIMMEKTIKNLPLLKRKLIDFYFPDVEPDTCQTIMRQNYPSVIGLLKQSSMEPSLQTEFLYILTHFDAAMREVSEIINTVRREMETLHRQFLEQHIEKLKQIQQAPVADKLMAISGLPQGRAPIKYSLSLLDEEMISFRPGEPDFFILGSRYNDILDAKYKYCHVTPASFIRALGSEAKHIIFEALLDMRPMSAVDMEVKLHLSRNAVAYNVKEMRESGVITIEHIEGLSYYYTLNREYIGIVAEQLKQIRYHGSVT